MTPSQLAVNSRLLVSLLNGVEEGKRQAAAAHERARFGSNADLCAKEAQAADVLAERYRKLAIEMFDAAFPGVDSARFARVCFP